MKTISLVFVIFILFNFTGCEALNDAPFTSRIAKYLIDYFHLEKLDILYDNENINKIGSKVYAGNKNISTYNRCDSINSIQDYFFNVYAGTEETFTLQDLDDLIHFHVKKSRKIENENRHKKYTCSRKQVISKLSIEKRVSVFLFFYYFISVFIRKIFLR